MHTHAGRRLAACSMNRVQAIMYDIAYNQLQLCSVLRASGGSTAFTTVLV